MARPWRDALAGGFAGTAVMTASLALEARVRTHHDGPVDYDASNHVVVAAAAITGWLLCHNAAQLSPSNSV